MESDRERDVSRSLFAVGFYRLCGCNADVLQWHQPQHRCQAASPHNGLRLITDLPTSRLSSVSISFERAMRSTSIANARKYDLFFCSIQQYQDMSRYHADTEDQ